jgi:S-methylmethionine-dependent homocysteine/selenocysteine methylase
MASRCATGEYQIPLGHLKVAFNLAIFYAAAERRQRPEILDGAFPFELRKVIESSWNPDPSERPDALQLLALVQDCDLPERALSAFEKTKGLLQNPWVNDGECQPGWYLSDAGLENWLVSHKEFELPEFAAYVVLHDSFVGGKAALREYYQGFAELAAANWDDGCRGCVLETPTWRASRGWAEKIDKEKIDKETVDDMANVNETAVRFVRDIADEVEREQRKLGRDFRVIVSGCVGPKRAGYAAQQVESAADYATYHAEQIKALRSGGADVITAMTMTHGEEVEGILRACMSSAAGLPAIVSWTVEVDGRLPSGDELGSIISRLDSVDGVIPAAYHMMNCSPATHFEKMFPSSVATDATNAPERTFVDWTVRIRGVRCNAVTESPVDLHDSGDADDLGLRIANLRDFLPSLNIFGSYCAPTCQE